MGLKERRAEAEAALRSSRGLALEGLPLPPRTLAADGYAFLFTELDLQVSILGKPILPLELSSAELRGKLEAAVGGPCYQTEAASEAYTYPLLVCGPDRQVTEGYLAAADGGCSLCGDEARRTDWPQVAAALEKALAPIRPADYEDRVWDPDAESWIYYGVRGGEPFEEPVEGEDPPEWAE
ncbi:MAG TPA: hypothetical protein VN033_11100 [Vulgatibacter sp.]|nr:hypothetical protein [Vulgatibacter sp.]